MGTSARNWEYSWGGTLAALGRKVKLGQGLGFRGGVGDEYKRAGLGTERGCNKCIGVARG